MASLLQWGQLCGDAYPSISGDISIKGGGKEWDFSLLFVRLYRSLDSIASDDQIAHQWLISENLGLHSKPITLIQTTEGLVRVVQYLDSSRGIV